MPKPMSKWYTSPLFGNRNNNKIPDDPLVKEALNSNSKEHIAMGNPNESIDGKLNGQSLNISTDSSQFSGDVCLVSESPYRILKVAANGNLKEFQRIYNSDPTKLYTKDSKQRSPVHHAALKGHTNILEFIVNHGGDLNYTDKDGNTALHLAVENGHKKSTGFLLSHNADTTIRNKRQSSPLHVCCEYKRDKIIELFCIQPGIDLNIEGEHGSTPLHTCAYHDSDECAKKLLQHGARICKPCHIGLFPMHIAAQNSSTKTFQVFIDFVNKSKKYKEVTSEKIIPFLNQEESTPLHSAINGGDIQVVKICLEAGIKIEDTTEDGSNAVHLAAAHGSLDIMQLLFAKYPDKKKSCIESKDLNGRTPLHRAALFDRTEIVNYLIDEGSKVNQVDTDGNTPWLLAASKKAWNVTHVFLNRGVDLELHDTKNRNILHIVIINGGKINDFNLCLCNKTMKNLLNESDNFGSTPLHYACRAGMLGTIENMLKMGAVINAKNKDKQSPLHFAAGCGRYNTCKHLLDTATGPNTINDTDGEGKTPLHEAACNGHVRVVAFLLQRGASACRDVQGNTPVHLAAMNGYTQTIKVVLEINSYLMDMPNKEGDTPLHLAAGNGHDGAVTMLLSLGAKILTNYQDHHLLDKAIKNQHKDVCVAAISHERWKEMMGKGSALYGCPMVGFVKHMPSVCQMVLDRCRISSDHDKNSIKFHYTYNFDYLRAPIEHIAKLKKEGKPCEPLCTLQAMVAHNRVDCISHPVCINFLRMKWMRIGLWFHLVNLLIYLVFLGSLTCFILFSEIQKNVIAESTIPGLNQSASSMSGVLANGTSIYYVPDEQSSTVPPKLENIYSEGYNKYSYHKVELKSSSKLLVAVILTFCIVNALKEIGQMYQQKFNYFTDITNLWEWILYITSALFIGPFAMGYNSSMQWQCAAIAVFLAWFNLLIFLQRFDFFGIYVVMFLEILKTLVQVIIVFSILIVAFGLTFYVLFFSVDQSVGHDNFWISMVTTAVMMTGSIEYVGNWMDPYYRNDLSFQTLTFIMLVVFILLIPILLVNLLIGLAVGDIEAIQRDARLKRIAMQVVYSSDLERKMPLKILQALDTNEYKVYPNCNKHMFQMCWNKITKAQGVEYGAEQSDGSGISTEQLFEMEHQSFIYEELNKQKLRLKHISKDLSKQHDMLRLIVQKMEIKTEADEYDDNGQEGSSVVKRSLGIVRDMGWSSPMLRQNLLKQSHVIAKWKASGSQDS